MVAIAGNIVENTDIVDWRIVAYKCKDGSLSGTALSSGTTYSVTCADADPCNVLLTPKIDYVWSANKSVGVNDYVVASNPDTTPHLWKATEVGDPYYSNVSLLLHCDGTNGSTTFTDNSPSPKTVTANGNAQISTAQSQFGGASGLFDGNEDYLSIADHADFEFGSGNFTLEAWVYLTAYPTANAGEYKADVISKDVSGARSFAFNLSGTVSSYTSIDLLGFSNNTTYELISASTSFSLNTWYHIAAVRSGNLIYLFKDGVLLNAGGTSFTTTIQDVATPILIGANNFDATYRYNFPGYIDDLRITKGVARYTANFTPPAGPFTDNKTGGTEPTWNLSGNTTDNSVTWTYVAPLIDPVSIGPKIPV